MSMQLDLVVRVPDAKNMCNWEVYISEQDGKQILGSDATIVRVKSRLFTVKTRSDVVVGDVWLGKGQAEWLDVHAEETVVVETSVRPQFTLRQVTISVHTLGSSDTELVSSEDLDSALRTNCNQRVLNISQNILMELSGTVLQCTPRKMKRSDGEFVMNGFIDDYTLFEFVSPDVDGKEGLAQVTIRSQNVRSVFRKDFSFAKLGIGGLGEQFFEIFRRAFAPRVFSEEVVEGLGIKHIRGMILHGPPGTGKTLIARKLAHCLRCADPKIVNGPEILNKYVGESEENIRKLFADAEEDYKKKGDEAQLHIIIFDEIDAICKKRGSQSDGTGAADGIVNQLLTKIDGVNEIKNVFVIGMTNRLDMIDEALLRPGRLELHMEIKLPSESGRLSILEIHTAKMKANGYLDKAFPLDGIAARTQNYSGAEIEGLVRSAASFALRRAASEGGAKQPSLRKSMTQEIKQFSNVDIGKIYVESQDFDEALKEVKPAFGVHSDEFEKHCAGAFLKYSDEFANVCESCTKSSQYLQQSETNSVFTMLLTGDKGSGTTALAAYLAKHANYPFARLVSNDDYVGSSESAKNDGIVQVFEDAYKSNLSVIVLDSIEDLIDYVPIGPTFSTAILQTIRASLKKRPSKPGCRLLVIATSSNTKLMEDCGLLGGFHVVKRIRSLTAGQICTVLKSMPGFAPEVAETIANRLKGANFGIKYISMAADMAVKRRDAIVTEEFLECLSDMTGL